MSLVQPMPDRRPSPTSATDGGLSLGLNSNNPFRRTDSPKPPSPVKQSHREEAHMSRNPFLDPAPQQSTGNNGTQHDTTTSQMADDIFKDLSTLEKTTSAGQARHGTSRSGTLPVRPREDERRGDRPSRPRPANGERSLLDSPDKSRPRRNSESSLMDRERTDEDKRRRERRREREREKRGDKDAKTKDGKSKPPRKGLDVIDKLDVTGIYGQGLFHHDGPFDACNPHRNRRKDHRAPMQAFPENSANNALAGGTAKKFDYDRFHGRGEESFAEFASSGQDYTTAPQARRSAREQASFNPTDRVEPVHGTESHGLGTSTFLEGAPASRSALQRRESERDEDPSALSVNGGGNMGGLGRKKSLAMRIRGISQPRPGRPGESNNRMISPEDQRSPMSPNGGGNGNGAVVIQSAGGPSRARAIGQEKNPFFNQDYDDAYDKKGAQIREVETTNNNGNGSGSGMGRPRAPSSPTGNGLTRSITADSGVQGGTGSYEDKPAGGFLSRMRSLKGGKRARPDFRG